MDRQTIDLFQLGARYAWRDALDFINNDITATGELDVNRFRAWLYGMWMISENPPVGDDVQG